MVDSATLAQLKDIGIAIVAVVGSGIIVYLIIKKGFAFLERIQTNYEEKEKWWAQYVDENNHRTSEMIEKHTEVLVEVKNTLGSHNQLLERLLDRTK